MRIRCFSTISPFFKIPERVASFIIPLLKTSESVFPCRSAVRTAIAFSSAERYKATLNIPKACFPWRDTPSVFLGRAINILKPILHTLYHKTQGVHTPKSIGGSPFFLGWRGIPEPSTVHALAARKKKSPLLDDLRYNAMC